MPIVQQVAPDDGKIYLLDSGNRRILVTDGASPWVLWRQGADWGNPYPFR